MARAGRATRVAGIAAGAAIGAAGAAVAARRALARGVRRGPDPDEGVLGALAFDEARRLPSHDGGSVYTISRGRGPAVVLSHGVTLSSRVWVKQLGALPAAGLRAVAFDHRGHGESLAGTEGHTVDMLAWDVRTVLEGLDLSGVVLVGHSMGGVAAQAFAIQFPEVAASRVRGLVLLSSLARTHLARSPLLRTMVLSATDHGPGIGELMSRPDFGLLLARLGFGRAPLPSHVELTRELLAACPHETSRPALRSLLSLDLSERLAEIALPTLVVVGSADLITPPAESRHIAARIPGARLEVLRGGGHMLMLEAADRLDALIVDFAREVGASDARPGRSR